MSSSTFADDRVIGSEGHTEGAQFELGSVNGCRRVAAEYREEFTWAHLFALRPQHFPEHSAVAGNERADSIKLPASDLLSVHDLPNDRPASFDRRKNHGGCWSPHLPTASQTYLTQHVSGRHIVAFRLQPPSDGELGDRSDERDASSHDGATGIPELAEDR